MNTSPSWLCQIPVTAAVRHAVESLRSLIPEGHSCIDIEYANGRLNADVELTDAQAAAALMLITSAAMRHEELCGMYGETVSATDMRAPEPLQQAIGAFDEHAMTTLRSEISGHVLNGEMSGMVRIYR